MDHDAAKKIAERFIRVVEHNDVAVFADEVFCDINVPEWRFQMVGARAVAEWLDGEQPDGCEVPEWSCEPTASGVVVQLVQKMGDEISRNMHLLEVAGDRVTHWTMYCTGVWSAEQQTRHAAEAQIIRP